MQQQDVPPPPVRPPTVLVVEDDTVLAMEAERMAGELGCDIVFMTAYGDPEIASDMRKIAGVDVLGKPISEPILRLVLREKLG